MKQMIIVLIATLISANCSAQVYGKFEARTAKLIAEQFRVSQTSQPAPNSPYLVMRAWPVGASSRLIKFDIENEISYNGIGHSFSFAKNDAKSLQFSFDQSQELKSSPDLYCAFCIYVPADCAGKFELTVWNYSRKSNRTQIFQVTPGEWQFVKIKLNGPNFFEDGDLLKGISIFNVGHGLRNWYMDNLVMWNGSVSAPQPVQKMTVVTKVDGSNLISWEPATGELPIIKYRIYRGSIPSFQPDSSSLIGETHLLNFLDADLMRPEYYYMVIAEDAAGNSSTAGHAVKPKTK